MDDRLAASRRLPPPPVADDGHPEVLPAAACLVCGGPMTNVVPCEWCKTPCCSERCCAEHDRFRHRTRRVLAYTLCCLAAVAVVAVGALQLWYDARR